jgi:3-methyl-2-oxobutanoate hydroxymethyltransferase
MGGYKVQGKTKSAARKLIEEAKAVENAGAFSIVLEGIPMALAREITKTLSIPSIGIGAGPYCDGQVLVLHDLLGLFDRFVPKFIKRYANLKKEAITAVETYIKEVEEGDFPSEDQSFK